MGTKQQPTSLIKMSSNEVNSSIIDTLLKDRSTDSNIVWASYGYQKSTETPGVIKQILLDDVTGKSPVVKPRYKKSEDTQSNRTDNLAEVFTPTWICNEQNNLFDRAWFGRDNVFNTVTGTNWTATEGTIVFPIEKTWQDYVRLDCLEVA